MPRLSYILVTLLLPACAASSQTRPSSSARVPSSDSQRATSEQVDSGSPGDASVATNPSPSQTSQATFEERTTEEYREYLRQFEDQAARVNLADGIDAAEAEFIAEGYFALKFGGCGATEKAMDGGEEWLIRPRVGVTGRALEDFIRVDKCTGAVRYGSGPTTEPGTAIEFQRKILQKLVERFLKRGPVQ
jgi:hypothetical protein